MARNLFRKQAARENRAVGSNPTITTMGDYLNWVQDCLENRSTGEEPVRVRFSSLPPPLNSILGSQLKLGVPI